MIRDANSSHRMGQLINKEIKPTELLTFLHCRFPLLASLAMRLRLHLGVWFQEPRSGGGVNTVPFTRPRPPKRYLLPALAFAGLYCPRAPLQAAPCAVTALSASFMCCGTQVYSKATK